MNVIEQIFEIEPIERERFLYKLLSYAIANNPDLVKEAITFYQENK